MKNWKILLIMLAVFGVMSCDITQLEPGGTRYHVSSQDMGDLRTVFGDEFMNHYADRIYKCDLKEGVIAQYDSGKDVITVDTEAMPSSLTLYILAHELAHGWQHTRMHSKLDGLSYYYVPLPMFGKLGTEQEAEVVAFHAQLLRTPVFTNGNQFVQTCHDVYLIDYMQKYMGF